MPDDKVLTLRFRSTDGRFHSGRPVYVIEETPERLVTFMPEGTEVAMAVLADGRELRDVPLAERWDHPRASALRPWQGSELIQIFPKGRAHSVWVVRDVDHAVLGWYVNLEEPHVLDNGTISTRDHVLDIWVPAETGEPEWKDEDELAAAVVAGRLTEQEALEIRAEGQRVWAERPWPTGWEDYRADPGRPRPELPAGWQAPTLCTERLALSPLAEHELDLYAGLRADPRTRAYSRSGIPVPAAQARQELLASCTAWRERGFGNWCIRRRSDGTFLGVIFAVSSGHDPATPELGWVVTPEAWGQGIATEAGRAVVDDLLARVRVATIKSQLRADNDASRRIAEKLGMSLREEADGVRTYELEASG